MKKRFGRKHILASLLLAVLMAGFWGVSQAAKPVAPAQPTVVVLSASWCGTCREISPMVRKVVSSSPELGLKLVTLDVDGSSAPAQAEQYGISVSGSNVPQVYLFSNGKTVLLFNGKNYKFGQSKAAEAEIRQRLQSSF